MENLIAIYDWDVTILKDRFNKLGLNVEAIGNPVTITGLRSRYEDDSNVSLNLDNLDDESRNKINLFLKEAKADCGYLMDKEDKGNSTKGMDNPVYKAYGSMIIMPCRLSKQDNTN